MDDMMERLEAQFAMQMAHTPAAFDEAEKNYQLVMDRQLAAQSKRLRDMVESGRD